MEGAPPITAAEGLGAALEAVLRGGFAPVALVLDNESGRHAVPRGSETHWNVLVVSERFVGLSRVARQRLVNEAVGPLFAQGLHALAMRTWTPEEWEASGQAGPGPTPPCTGTKTHPSE